MSNAGSHRTVSFPHGGDEGSLFSLSDESISIEL